MGGLELLLKPFRLVENEFESFVNGLYSVYSRRTGKSQYELSNFFAVGAVVYNSAKKILENNIDSLERVIENVVIWDLYISLGTFYFFNNMAKSRVKKLKNSDSLLKDPFIEYQKIYASILARTGLFLLWLDALTSGLSMVAPTYLPDENPLLKHFGTMTLLLITLSGYSGRIDTNNPKRSKVMEAARNGLSYLTARIPQKAPVKIPIRYDSINIDPIAQSLPLQAYPLSS